MREKKSDVVVPTTVANRRDQSFQEIARDEIPLIDLSNAFLPSGTVNTKKAREIRDACTTIGFFYIINHGIPQRQIDRTIKHSKDFFGLPASVKLRYDINRIKRHRGFVPIGALSADPDLIDHQEGYEVGLELPESDPDYQAGSCLFGPNVWPREIENFQTDVYAYFEAVFALGKRLFELFAVSLELPQNYFLQYVNKPVAQLRLLYYPESDIGSSAELTNGVGPHTDYECFTMLYQTDIGLQVQNPNDDWIMAPPVEGAFVINIGDTLQRWTNDLFKSTPHRVISNTGKARYSMPFFFAADHDCIVKPLPKFVSEHNPPQYPPTHTGYWIENMHTYSYRYRWHERGKLPNPELDPENY